jgi:hypothetical protein
VVVSRLIWDMMAEQEYLEKDVNFRETVAAGGGTRVTRSLNYDGVITQVMFHFPPGSNGLVDVRLLKDEKPFYPVDGFLSLDDSTPIFYTSAQYYRKEPLTVEIHNRDGINAHSPTVTVTIRVKKPWWE